MRDAVRRSALSLVVGVVLAAPAHAQQAKRLSLADAVAMAREATPPVNLARLREREAQARAGQARGVLLPSFGGAASYSTRTFNLATFGLEIPTPPGTPPPANLVGPIDNIDARLKVSQSLFDPSGWARIGAARRGVEQAEADRTNSVELAAQGAAFAYLRAARAQAVVEARTSDLSLARDLLQLAEAQERAGTAPAIEATRARTQVATSQGAVLVARNQLDLATIELARALGLDPMTRLELADTLAADLVRSDVPEDAAGAVVFATASRPDLSTERARLAVARSQKSAIGWERVGRIEAAADWGVSGTKSSDAIPTREVSVAWNVPLLDGLRREARIAEQSSVLEESEVRARELRDQIAADVSAALLELASGRDQRDVALERLRLAQQEVDQARARFTAGIAGSLELVNAQSTLVRARDADIDARFAVATARVAVAHAAGVARNIH